MRPDLLGDAQNTSEKQFAILQKPDGMNAHDIMKMAETAPCLPVFAASGGGGFRRLLKLFK